VAGFVAQCRVESADFTRLEENLRYRSPEVLDRTFRSVVGLGDAARLIQLGPQAIANRVYAGRLGNGPEASGDGWRYRGRGLKQLTGRDNYAEAAQALGRPYLEQPHLVAEPADACLTAAWFWHTIKGNALADSAQWDAITRAVNGPAMLQAAERRQYAEEAVRAFA
jgi:putative chitinase